MNKNYITVETKEVAQQIKLGAFVLVGLGLFLTAVFLIGSENNIFSRTFTIFAEFKNVEGLKEGDNVWLSGVKVGTVADVRIASQGRVIVKMTLKDRQSEFIRKDAAASIGSDGLVGNKIVVLRPGMSSRPVDPDDTISTSSPADTQELINIAKDVGENTRSLTADLSMIAKRINEGQGVAGELLNDGALAQELRQAVKYLTTTSNNTALASAELHKLFYDLRHGDGLLPVLISDTAYSQTFKHAINNIEQMSASAATVSNNLQSLSTKLNDNDNTIGALLTDEALANKLKNTISNTEQASQKLDENMKAMQHNFLFRGYFRKQEKREKKEAEAASSKQY